MNNPLVSIIIPIYNSEAFLDKCIQSAVNQSYKNIEIILVDDGSIDSSGDFLHKLFKTKNSPFHLDYPVDYFCELR